MSSKKIAKTNAARLLERLEIPFIRPMWTKATFPP